MIENVFCLYVWLIFSRSCFRGITGIEELEWVSGRRGNGYRKLDNFVKIGKDICVIMLVVGKDRVKI